MGLILDTSVIIKLEREGASEDFNPVFDRDQVAISVVTVSELLAGVFRSGSERKLYRLAFVEEMLDRLEPLPITPRVARIHADMAAYMKEEGHTIGVNDEWIAATALAHGATVATLNRKDFDKVPGITVVSPND